MLLVGKLYESTIMITKRYIHIYVFMYIVPLKHTNFVGCIVEQFCDKEINQTKTNWNYKNILYVHMYVCKYVSL